MLGWPGSENPAIALLEKIDACGSISQAAKAAGMSYKSAWEQLDALNNLSPRALVVRQVGGCGGGGTILTDEGRLLLQRVRMLRRELQAFMTFFGDQPEEAFNTLKTMRRIEMKVSARNVWAGRVGGVEKGAVNSIVEVALKGGDSVVAVITNNSVERLGLAPGVEVLAMVKAPSVMVGRDCQREKLSASNILTGTISHIDEGAVNDVVTIDLPGGSTVTAVITREGVRTLGLGLGVEASAIIKASSVILAVS
ncbi:MAG: TOBE domain-containing protein [Proteobacteria bacterium]|nr:TOBE domain-containing protein [Pseudomonadota bacterium]MBU4297638.1 TOBE domain-containing protein [Pseudomonadota bacterium]